LSVQTESLLVLDEETIFDTFGESHTERTSKGRVVDFVVSQDVLGDGLTRRTTTFAEFSDGTSDHIFIFGVRRGGLGFGGRTLLGGSFSFR